MALAEIGDVVVVAEPSGAIEAAARKALGVTLKGIENDHAWTLAVYKPGMSPLTLEAVLAPPVIQAALEANFSCVDRDAVGRAAVPDPLAVRDTRARPILPLKSLRDIAMFSLGAIASRRKQSGQEFPTHNMR